MMQRLKLILASLLVVIGLASSFVVLTPRLAAAEATDCAAQGMENLSKDYDPNQKTCCPKGHSDSTKSCLYAKYINPTIKVLSGIAALAAVIGIIMGAIQYASSGGDPQKAAAGKGKIIKAIYGLLAFIFLYSMLQFMSPGGIGANTEPSGGKGSIASQCSKPFLGIKPWFAYLPDSAFEDGTCNIDNFSLFGDADSGSDLFPVLLAIADGLVKVAGMVAVVFVIVGGVQYVTSQGEPDRTKRARDSIINALIGLAIAIIATSVVSFIGSQLTR